MQKICYLHVGLHKTATSSFQQTCKSNVDLLQANGVTYPLFSCPAASKLKMSNHSIPIFSLFTEGPEDYHINKRWGLSDRISEINSSYNNQFTHYLRSSGDLLISGEDISALGEKSLFELTENIKCHNYEIKAIALVRSPYSAICSELQEGIKSGRFFELISLNNHVPTIFSVKSFNKTRQVKKLKSIFGDSICFYSFENACMHSRGPVGFLLREFLNQDPSSFVYQKTNESLSNLSVRIQNEFNAINPAFVGRNYNAHFRSIPRKVDQRLGFSGKFLLTEVEYAFIEEFVKRETENLNEITGLDFSCQSLKFSKPVF